MESDYRIEFLSSLYEALADRPQETAELRESLEERGVDVNKALHEARATLGRYRKAHRLRAARERVARVQQAITQWVDGGKLSGNVVREDLARALAGDAGATGYQAYYRKLQEVSEEDLASLGEDAELLDFVERITVVDTE